MELFNESERELIDAAKMILSDGVRRLKTRTGLFLNNRTTRAERAAIVAERGILTDYLCATYGTLRHEVIVVSLIDPQGRLIDTVVHAEGKNTSVIVNTRLLAESIIRSGASAIVLAHNHPSGDNTPSSQDVKLTDHLKTWLKYMDVDLIDHLVLSPEGASAILGEF